MNSVNETLDPKHGWSSGRKMPQGAPPRGLGRSHMNDDVIAWVPGVHNVAVRMVPGVGPWFYRIMEWPGLEPAWMPCEFKGDPNMLPEINTLDDLLTWASTKQFQGLNILDK